MDTAVKLVFVRGLDGGGDPLRQSLEKSQWSFHLSLVQSSNWSAFRYVDGESLLQSPLSARGQPESIRWNLLWCFQKVDGVIWRKRSSVFPKQLGFGREIWVWGLDGQSCHCSLPYINTNSHAVGMLPEEDPAMGPQGYRFQKRIHPIFNHGCLAFARSVNMGGIVCWCL